MLGCVRSVSEAQKRSIEEVTNYDDSLRTRGRASNFLMPFLLLPEVSGLLQNKFLGMTTALAAAGRASDKLKRRALSCHRCSEHRVTFGSFSHIETLLWAGSLTGKRDSHGEILFVFCFGDAVT